MEPDLGQVAPAASARRRELGAASARSLLLTVLGEFVEPADEPVWTSTLVAALALVGVEEKAARQAVARTATEGLVAPERLGRRTRWRLTPGGRRLLVEGRERIYGFMRSERPWDGRWLVLLIGVPESQRQLRHRLRTRLTWAGFGSPMPGVWVVPDAGKAAELAAVVAELGLGPAAFSWVGPIATVGDEQALVRSAWTLAAVEERYADFLRQFRGATAGSPREAFTWQVRLVQHWRRFPFLDPALPPQLLDHDWPGPQAAATFLAKHEAWHERAQAYWRSLSEGAEGAEGAAPAS